MTCAYCILFRIWEEKKKQEEKMRMSHNILDFEMDFAKGEGSLPLIEDMQKGIPKIKTDFADKEG